ncbi:olfactory receptor 52E8-like [Puntigrus tetrazona]|uniref:olfactory receptor 52E8-like n=1 Tax=Puntigrus tetrazona TaxID=1606681 RepID=UPI001C88FEE1|nr:olfactory receptor 52E8-like [Puntigrus tetrazona]
MENGTMPYYFYFTLFKDFVHMRYPILILTLSVYLAIVLFNAIILFVVFKERSLHEPMYILISCLSANDLYGSAGFFPRLMVDLLFDANTISRPGCFVQIFIIYTYAMSEYTILTLMAYDRYVAICNPLKYHTIMTPKVTILYMGLASLYTVFSMSLVIFFSARLPLCGTDIARLYCSNWSLDSTIFNNSFSPAFFIFYTYARILIICQKSPKEFRGKAFQTCLPHIISFVNYSIASFCDIALSRYDSDKFKIVAIIFSVEFLVIPPVLNPLIYGLNLLEIRKTLHACFSDLNFRTGSCPGNPAAYSLQMLGLMTYIRGGDLEQKVRHPVVNPGNLRQIITGPPPLGTAPDVPNGLVPMKTVKVPNKSLVQDVASRDPGSLLRPNPPSPQETVVFPNQSSVQ